MWALGQHASFFSFTNWTSPSACLTLHPLPFPSLPFTPPKHPFLPSFLGADLILFVFSLFIERSPRPNYRSLPWQPFLLHNKPSLLQFSSLPFLPLSPFPLRHEVLLLSSFKASPPPPRPSPRPPLPFTVATPLPLTVLASLHPGPGFPSPFTPPSPVYNHRETRPQTVGTKGRGKRTVPPGLMTLLGMSSPALTTRLTRPHPPPPTFLIPSPCLPACLPPLCLPHSLCLLHVPVSLIPPANLASPCLIPSTFILLHSLLCASSTYLLHPLPSLVSMPAVLPTSVPSLFSCFTAYLPCLPFSLPQFLAHCLPPYFHSHTPDPSPSTNTNTNNNNSLPLLPSLAAHRRRPATPPSSSCISRTLRLLRPD